MRGKKASLRLMLFLVLTLVLAISTIFMFLTNFGKSEPKIYTPLVYNDVYYQENELHFYLNQIAETSFFEIYDEIIKNDYYISELIYNPDNYVNFENLNINLNNLLEKNFREKFEEKFKNIDFEKKHLNKLKNKIISGNYSLIFNDEVLAVSLINLNLENSMEGIEIFYKPEINIKINLTRKKLHSFQEIYEFKEKCVSISNLTEKKDCYEDYIYNLENFNIGVIKEVDFSDKEYLLIKFTTKNDFLINGEFKHMVFSFIPK